MQSNLMYSILLHSDLASVSRRLFFKRIFPKDFRNSLVSLVGWRKYELTYFKAPLIKRVPPLGEKSKKKFQMFILIAQKKRQEKPPKCPKKFAIFEVLLDFLSNGTWHRPMVFCVVFIVPIRFFWAIKINIWRTKS